MLSRWLHHICEVLRGTAGHYHYAALILLLTTSLIHIRAETSKKCSRSEAMRARLEIGRLEDWSSMYASYKRFRHCDVGALAEEYSYAISRLLSRHWDDVAALLSLTAEHEEFKGFILRHINEDIPEEEAQRIINNSRQHCPANGEWLCRAIVDY
jgi:hypothetical protein